MMQFNLFTCDFLLDFEDHFLIRSLAAAFAARFVPIQFVSCSKAQSTQPFKNLNRIIHNKKKTSNTNQPSYHFLLPKLVDS